MNAPLVPLVALGFGSFLLAHVLFWRIRRADTPRLGRLALLAAAGLLLLLCAGILWLEERPAVLFAAAALDLLLVTAYFFFYAGIARSVSVTILADLLARPARSLPFANLVSTYGSSSRFHDRVGLLQRSQLVVMAGEHVELTPRGRRLALWSRRLAAALTGGLHG